MVSELKACEMAKNNGIVVGHKKCNIGYGGHPRHNLCVVMKLSTGVIDLLYFQKKGMYVKKKF